ncbi:hypothetical protein J3A83DRAFT_1575567 [Scleroderma citrinum]
MWMQHTHRPAHLHHLRAQFTSILHALSSTFTTCACGSAARDCAVKVMECVVDGRWPWPRSHMRNHSQSRSRSRGQRSCSGNGNGTGACDASASCAYASGSASCGESAVSSGEGSEVDLDGTESEREGGGRPKSGHTSTKSKSKSSTKSKGATKTTTPTTTNAHSILKNGDTHASTANGEDNASKRPIDLGPLVGVQRGFRTREREPMSGGWCGVEVVPSSLAWPGDVDVDVDVEGDGNVDTNGSGKTKWREGKKRRTREKGKARAIDVDVDVDGSDMNVHGAVIAGTDHVLPPRMRKLWSHPPDHQPELQPGPSGSTPESTSPTLPAYDGSGMSGQETEFDTETEGEDTADDTRQMPPPPMPASLDPTTVSSLTHAHAYIKRSASPLASVPVAKAKNVNGKRPRSPCVPPRWTPTWGTSPPLPASTSISISTPTSTPCVVNSFQSLIPPQLPPPCAPILSTTSPSAPFSKLSLLSPDMQPGWSVSVSTNSPTLVDPPPPATTPQTQTQPQVQRRLSAPSCARDTSTPHTDTKRAAPAEPYRVRFMSPEMLGEVPSLKSRTMDANGVLGLGIKVEESRQEENEAMDVGRGWRCGCGGGCLGRHPCTGMLT